MRFGANRSKREGVVLADKRPCVGDVMALGVVLTAALLSSGLGRVGGIGRVRRQAFGVC